MARLDHRLQVADRVGGLAFPAERDRDYPPRPPTRSQQRLGGAAADPLDAPTHGVDDVDAEIAKQDAAHLLPDPHCVCLIVVVPGAGSSDIAGLPWIHISTFADFLSAMDADVGSGQTLIVFTGMTRKISAGVAREFHD